MVIKFINKIYNAARYSCKGILYAWKTQWALRFEFIILLFSFPCALYFSASAVEFILLISSILLIIMFELMNSAVETVVNRISLEQHELSGAAKDMASAAIMIACINASIIWLIIIIK